MERTHDPVDTRTTPETELAHPPVPRIDTRTAAGAEEAWAVSFLIPPAYYLERTVETLELLGQQSASRRISTQVTVGDILDPRGESPGASIPLAGSFAVRPMIKVPLPPYDELVVPGSRYGGGRTADPVSVWVPAVVMPHRTLASRINVELDGRATVLPLRESSRVLTEAILAASARDWCMGADVPDVDRETLVRLAIGAASPNAAEERYLNYHLFRRLIARVDQQMVDDTSMAANERLARDDARVRLIRWVRVAASRSIVWLPVPPRRRTTVKFDFAVPSQEIHTIDRLFEFCRRRRGRKVPLQVRAATARYDEQPRAERSEVVLNQPHDVGLSEVSDPVRVRDVARQLVKSAGRQLGVRPEKSEIFLMPWLARTHHVQLRQVPGTLCSGLFPAWSSPRDEDRNSEHRSRLALEGEVTHLYLEHGGGRSERTDAFGTHVVRRRPNRAVSVLWPDFTGHGRTPQWRRS